MKEKGRSEPEKTAETKIKKRETENTAKGKPTETERNRSNGRKKEKTTRKENKKMMRENRQTKQGRNDRNLAVLDPFGSPMFCCATSVPEVHCGEIGSV